MTSENKKGDSLKAKYLDQVQKALSSVKHPRSKDILDDVRCHLEQRFAELEPDEQTRESLQTIIDEMGPASDYAEFLDPDATSPSQSVRPKCLLSVGLVAVVIIALAILLPLAISHKVKGHKHLTISKVYWFHSDQRPQWISGDAVPKDNDGHMLFHVDEWFEEMGTTAQYRPFLNKVDKRFVLKAEGYPDVHANAERGCWSQEFYVRIPEKEYVKMKANIPYTVHPLNLRPKYQWKVSYGVAVHKLNE
ncbi:MAG: HAAS signaling domain-containing protein [Planctomycetota bacterium]|jgi:hypothetical protein